MMQIISLKNKQELLHYTKKLTKSWDLETFHKHVQYLEVEHELIDEFQQNDPNEKLDAHFYSRMLGFFHYPEEILKLLKEIFPQWHAVRKQQVEEKKSNFNNIKQQPCYFSDVIYQFLCLYDVINIDFLYALMNQQTIDHGVNFLVNAYLIENKENKIFLTHCIHHLRNPQKNVEGISENLPRTSRVEVRFMERSGLSRNSSKLDIKAAEKFKEISLNYISKITKIISNDEEKEKNIEISLGLFNYIRDLDSDYEPFYKIEDEKLRSLTMLTKMLANETKVPFEKLRDMMQELRNVDKLDDLKNNLASYSQQLTHSMNEINSKIRNMMSYNSEQNLEKSLINLHEQITKKSIEKLADFSSYNFNDCLQIEFSSEHYFWGDINKIKFILCLLVQNAFEAMQIPGKIWIKSDLVDLNEHPYVKICVGNSNSYIPEENLETIFNVFYSSKPNAWGMGLAIAQKIIKLHDGQIWCESNHEKGTEFFILLPAVNSESSEIKTLLLKKVKDSDTPSISENDQHIKINSQTQLNIAIIEDEEIYRSHLIKLIEDYSKKKNKIIQTYQLNVKSQVFNFEFLKANPDCIILDLDLANQNFDGLDVLKHINELHYDGLVCIHTNRDISYLKRDMDIAKFDLFIPKPLSQLQMDELIKASTKKREQSNCLTDSVALIDDNGLFLEYWKKKYSQIQTYFSPEDFFAHLDRYKKNFNDYRLIITDFDFSDVESHFDGYTFAQKMRALGFQKNIYLMSNFEIPSTIEGKVFDKVFSKTIGLDDAILNSN